MANDTDGESIKPRNNNMQGSAQRLTSGTKQGNKKTRSTLTATEDVSGVSCMPDDEKATPKALNSHLDHPVKEISTPTDDASSGPQPNRLQFVTLSIAMALSVFIMALDESIIATAIPRITDAFNSLDDVGWYGSGYMMTMACFQLTFGKLYKHISSKWILLSALVIFELGSAISASAPNSDVLIVGRVIAGLGASGIVNGVLIIISQVVPIRQRAIYTSSVGSIYGIAAVCGPLLGGVLTDSSLTWRWCFYINLPLGAIVGTIILGFYHPAPVESGEKLTSSLDWLKMLDPIGLALFTGSIIFLILALQTSGALGWGSAEPIIFVVLFGVLMLAFCGVQIWLQERGTLPPRIARMPRIIFASLYAFFLDSTYYIVAYFLPIWFQAVNGTSAETSGIRLIPIIIAAVLFSLVSGVVVSRTGNYSIMVILASIIAATGSGLLSTMTTSSGSGEWIGFQTMVGIGVGLGMQQSAVVVQDKLDKRDIPTAISTVTLFQALGSAIMVSVTQNIFASRVYDQLHDINPKLTRSMIINSGATEIISLATPENYQVFLNAISLAITQGYYVAAAGAALSGIFAFGLGFRKLQH